VVDEALGEFRAESERVGGAVHRAYAPALDAVGAVQELRARVDAAPEAVAASTNRELSTEMFGRYTELIDGLFDAGDSVAVEVDDADLRRGAEIVTLGTRQLDTNARLIRELLLGAIQPDGTGFDEVDERRPVEQLVVELRSRLAAIELNATGAYRPHLDELMGHETVTGLPQLADTALETGRVDLQAVLAMTGPDVVGYDDMLEGVTAELSDRADASTGRAARLQVTYTVLGLLVLALVAALAWMVSRSITRPLRLLTEQAQRMAGEDLPRAVSAILEAPTGAGPADVTGAAGAAGAAGAFLPPRTRVEVPGRDEVGAVAEALNVVQGAAVELAMEQAILRRNVADSFVNLGCRNHDLLARQLEFITELERHETDADALASLFRLDHLVSR
jgi:HAMP domain-containing protein